MEVNWNKKLVLWQDQSNWQSPSKIDKEKEKTQNIDIKNETGVIIQRSCSYMENNKGLWTTLHINSTIIMRQTII